MLLRAWMPPILLFLVNVVDRNGTQMNLGADHCVGKRSCGLPAIAVSCGSFTFCGGMAADFGNQQKEVLPGPQSFVTGQISGLPGNLACLPNHVVVCTDVMCRLVA